MAERTTGMLENTGLILDIGQALPSCINGNKQLGEKEVSHVNFDIKNNL